MAQWATREFNRQLSLVSANHQALMDPNLQCLLPVFTEPTFQTHVEVLLGWVMYLSKRTEYGVFQTIQADTPVSRKKRHPFDRFYNFFSRAAWTVHDLAHQVGRNQCSGECHPARVMG